MLRKEAVEAGTFRLLRTLMDDTKLSDFVLVGGTALALYVGHRRSIDLDLFTKNPFDESSLGEHIVKRYNFDIKTKFNNTLMGMIDDIKVDFIAHQYKIEKRLSKMVSNPDKKFDSPPLQPGMDISM